MAQLPPAAVFGSAAPGQAVHVLLLIENSLAMLDHWTDLQQHILPGVLGAVRIANPGTDVSSFLPPSVAALHTSITRCGVKRGAGKRM